MLAGVRFGSLADMTPPDWDVRFTPKAGIRRARLCPIPTPEFDNAALNAALYVRLVFDVG